MGRHQVTPSGKYHREDTANHPDELESQDDDQHNQQGHDEQQPQEEENIPVCPYVYSSRTDG